MAYRELPQALVIGGTRFVGLPLVELLRRAQYQVTVLNRGHHNHRLPAGVEVLIADRRDATSMELALRGRRFALVFDLIAYAPGDTRALLGALDTGGLEHLVHISTGSVYLPTDRFPQDEDCPRGLQGPGHEYGDQKYEIEELLLGAYRDRGLPVTIIRPGVLFGPWNYVYREAFFFDRLLAGRPLLVPNDGSVLTQFGYVDDLARLMLAVTGNRRAIGEAYNFAGAHSVTTDHYFETIIAAVGDALGSRRPAGGRAGAAPPVVHYQPEALGLAPEEVRRAYPFRVREHVVRDTSKARRHLGYREAVDLAEGLRRSFAWFQAGGREACGFGAPDFALEDRILAQVGGMAAAR